MTITETPTHFEFEFPYRKHIVEAIKRTFPYDVRSYDPVRRIWTVDKAEVISVKAFAEQYKFIWNKVEEPEKVDYSIIPPLPELDVDTKDYLNIEPFPYQRQGIAFALREKKALCGDDMGLGKTLQAIATAIIANAFPVLVVCPASLKYNWQDEFMKFGNIRSAVLSNSIRQTWPNYYRATTGANKISVFITNYESLMKYFVVKIPREDEQFNIKKIQFADNVKLFKMIIVDECHKIKNPSTRQSRLLRGLATFMDYRLFLSGTPIVNNAQDLIPILSALGRLKDLGGYSKFSARYCSKQTTNDDLAEMNYRLRTTCLFKREKKEVLKDLPEKTRQIVHCDLTNQKDYDKAENDFRAYLRENVGASDEQITKSMQGEVMVKISHLKRLAAKGKLKDAIEYIQNVNESGQKIIIFCWHKGIAKEIQSAFPSFKIIDGDTDPQVRHGYVKYFQENESNKGIIGTIGTMGVGYNLTASAIVLFIEMGWSPKDQDQAEDRSLRIGQQNAVFCPYMIGRNTIDEHIYDIIDTKRKLVKAAFGIKHDVQTDIIHDIIKLYKN